MILKAIKVLSNLFVKVEESKLPSPVDSRKRERAKMLFLSKFLKGRSRNEMEKKEYWALALGCSPSSLIADFINESLVEVAPLDVQAQIAYNAESLKKICKAMSLKSSGAKQELIGRILACDPQFFLNDGKIKESFVCTARGKLLAEEYLSKTAEEKLSAEKIVYEALKVRNYRGASLQVAAFEAKQPLARGLGIDWGNHNPNRDILVLRMIEKVNPQTLRHLSAMDLSAVKLVAQQMHLWGNSNAFHWVSDGSRFSKEIDVSLSCRMMMFAGIHYANLDEFRDLGAKKIEILCANDGLSCSACKEIGRKKYTIENVPELPYRGCTCEYGCRCTAAVSSFS